MEILYPLLCWSFIFVICWCGPSERNSLSKYIRHYEPLRYNQAELISNHHRTRRSADINTELHLNFNSHGRHFPLRLRRDTTLFTDNFVPNGNEFHPSNVYHGHLANDKNARVNGFIHNDIFEGKIKTSSGKIYQIEPSKQYFDDPDFHSVIFDVDDINYPHPYGSNCGVKDETRKWMSNIQSSADEQVKLDSSSSTSSDRQNQDGSHNHRQRRAFDRTKTVCHLFLQADPTYTDQFASTEDRALFLMTQHVKEASDIYSQTNFQGSAGVAEGVTFVIEKMIANTSAECGGSCPFAPTNNIGVAKYLELNSEQDHSEFCLAYVFGYRDFADGVLGLAWIGEPSGAAGGICETHRSFGGLSKSLNTGIVTTLNYGQNVPSRVTDITFAHELGHNFGAKHDDVNSATCSPGSSGGGNFIMYPRATSGSDVNNFMFSTCSRSAMWSVIDAKADRCFEVPGGPICGNKIVETGEECDCGWDGECSDICCIAKGQTNACKYSTLAQSSNRCSLSDGPCCDGATCQISAAGSKNCSMASECSQASLCDGNAVTCPNATTKPDLSFCQNEAKVCKNGACTGSICEKSNEVECMCTSEAAFCDICCRGNGTDTTCTSKNKKQVAGAPCDNYLGYCDIFSKCRKVDADGPLSRLKNFIFSSDGINNVIDWMKEYWWACILIGLGVILLMAGFIKLCSVHTPSSNPNMKAARQLSLPRTLSRRRRHPQTNPNASSANYGGRGGRPTNYPSEGEHLPGYETALRQPGGGNRGQPVGYEMRHGYR